MNTLRHLLLTASALAILTACQPHSQNSYDYSEVGKSQVVEFGTVIAARQVDIHGQNTGAGAALGGAAGGVGGYQAGNGEGQVATALAGVAAGAIIGGVAEQAAANTKGMEYTITRENGRTVTVVQPIAKDERVFKPGDRVMVQLSGSYQRVLPTDNVPTQIKRPQGVKFID